MIDALEVKTKKTYDSWGNEGVCTYYRLTEWHIERGWPDAYATVYCSDTSSGHGWQGRMYKPYWESLK